MTWNYIKHFAHFLVMLEFGLQGLRFGFVRDFLFEYVDSFMVLNLLWNITDVFFLMLIIGGFFKYLKQEGFVGLLGYLKWIVCSLVLMFLFNARLFIFFYQGHVTIWNLESFDFGVFLARFFLLFIALFFLALLYYDMVSKRIFVIELPFLVGLLLWFFLLAVRSFNFLFLFLIMESITLLIVVILSIYFIFFGAKLLKPVIHFFVFNLVISTFFLLGLGVLFFLIPVSSSENISYLMILINFWTLFLSGFVDPLLLLFVFKFIIVCFLLPFLFKLTIAPLSFWVVNIYSKLPIIFLFILMGLYKFIYILLFIKIFVYTLDLVTVLQSSVSLSLVWCIIPSMFIGCFAYRSADLKTIIALTTVSQMGYVLAGLISHDVMAIKYAIIYLLVYILNISGIFIIFIKLQKYFFLTNLNQLFIIKNYSKKWFYILFVLFASLGGFPPFAGFFLKYFLFLHIYKAGFFVLAAAGIISGYVMSIIYLQILMELSIIRTIPWSQYQSFLLNGLHCNSGTSNLVAVCKNENSKFTYQTYVFINLSLLFFFSLNVFFIGFFPFFSHYFGIFTFFFVYGLYWNLDLPAVREEMVWFANSFMDVPMAFQQNSKLEEFYCRTVNFQRQLDALFFNSFSAVERAVDIEFGPTFQATFNVYERLPEKAVTEFTHNIWAEADAFNMSFSRGDVGQVIGSSYINAWYIPSLTLEEYLVPLEWFRRMYAFDTTPVLFDSLSSLKMLVPTLGLETEERIYKSGQVYFLGSLAQITEFRMLVSKSAYDVIDKKYFGYALWDADLERIQYDLGHPLYSPSNITIPRGWTEGWAGVPDPDWSKGKEYYNPLTGDPFVFSFDHFQDLAGLETKNKKAQLAEEFAAYQAWLANMKK